MANPNLFRTLASLGAALMIASAASADTAVGPLGMGAHIYVGASRGVADPVIYDTTTGSTPPPQFTTTTTNPHTFVGGAANIAGAGPQVDVTSFDVYMVSATAVSYTNIRARVQFWDTYTAAGSPIFSNPVGGPIELDLGPTTTQANFVTRVTFTLATPLRLNSLTNKGFGISFQGDTGTGLAETADLVSGMNVNGAQAIGTSAVAAGNGFYRNASGRTDFNFLPSDLRTFANITDVRTALTLRGQSSVPVMLQSFDVK